MWTTILSGLTLGTLLMAVGLRGRRVDDHPLCRRCRFDLTGRPADTERRCPECGSDLNARRATVVGRRRRRGRWVTAGLVLLVPTVAAGGLLEWGRARHVNWLAYAPLPYLLHEARAADGARRGPALAELTARGPRLSGGQWDAVVAAATAYDADPARPWDAGWGTLLRPTTGSRRPSAGAWAAYVATLAVQATAADSTRRRPALAELTARLADTSVDRPTWATIVGIGLAYQGDRTKPWEPAWGTLLEDANGHGRLSADQWQRYARQILGPETFGLSVRPRVRRGDPLPAWWHVAAVPRAANPSVLRPAMADVRVTWASQPRPPADGSRGFMSWYGNGLGSSFGVTVGPADFPAGVADGLQHVHLTAMATIRPTTAGGQRIDRAAPPLATVPVDVPATFDLLPATRPSVATVHDDAVAAVLRRSIRIDLERGSLAPVHIRAEGSPIGLAFDVLVGTGGHKVKLTAWATQPFTGPLDQYLGSNVDPPTGSAADVILRANPAAAAETIDVFQVWDGELVFKDVPIR